MKDIERYLRKLIQEEIEKIRLDEMAIARKDFKAKVDSLLPQIIENLCLVLYDVYADRSIYKTHWAREMRGHLMTLLRLDVKGKNNYVCRRKVMDEVIADNDFDIPNKISLTIDTKFRMERIDMDSPVAMKVVQDAFPYLNELLDCVCRQDVGILDSAINDLTGCPIFE